MGLFNKIWIFTSKKLENWCNGMGSYPSYHKDLIHPANHKGGVSISCFSPGMFVGWLTTTHGQSLEVHKKGHNQRVNYHFSPCLMVKSWWNWWNHHFSPLSMVKSCQIHDNPPFLGHDSHGSRWIPPRICWVPQTFRQQGCLRMRRRKLLFTFAQGILGDAGRHKRPS